MKRRPANAPRATPSIDEIRTVVANSTAIETGENSTKIKERLSSEQKRFPQLTLAD